MPHDNRHSTLVRGADGVLYEVSDDASKPVPMILDEVSASSTESAGRIAAGLSDHAAARIRIDPGDHAAARIRIDPGDYAAASIRIEPGYHAAARPHVDAGD